ncbi:MAG: biotin/lipoyl-binding protein [Clostridiales bacterium]|nr:biotin/lipoyl-binding protein [Clostridiales bacterium]
MRKFNVVVNGKSYSVDVEEVGGDTTSAPVAPVAAPAAAPAPAAVKAGTGTPIKSPMPGLILSLTHKDGDTVKKNDKILVLEAMKMENDINAIESGVITYAVKKGDNVETGTVLAYIG